MTAPSAWRATLPVSMMSGRPPQSISRLVILNIFFYCLSNSLDQLSQNADLSGLTPNP
jgi:hypothetical protein